MPRRPMKGSLSAGLIEIDAEVESEKIQFESFFAGHGHAENAEHGELVAGAARGAVDHRAVDRIVFADGGGGQIHAQFRYLRGR